MSRAFQSNSELLHIQTKSIPIESPNFMSFVERYHIPVRRAYNIIKSESPETNNEEALQMAVKSVNDSVGLDGLVSMLLVYGALPRLGVPSDSPSPSTFQRAIAVRKATKAISKHFARRQVFTAVRTINGPKTSDIHTALIDSHILIYRPEKDRWEGPYTLLDMQGETCTILLPSPAVPSKFRSTEVKRFIPDDLTPNANETSSTIPNAPMATNITNIFDNENELSTSPHYPDPLPPNDTNKRPLNYKNVSAALKIKTGF